MRKDRHIANRGHHRGNPTLENSIEAVHAAAQQGLAGVKVDVAIVGGVAALHRATHQMGEHLGSTTLNEARHITGRSIPTLEDLLNSAPTIPVILELHQSALVDMAADMLPDLPEGWRVASLDHQAVLRCAVEHGCHGLLLIAHRPLPGTMFSIPHPLVDAIGWRSWPTWPDEIDAARGAGWTSYLWNEVLPEDRIRAEMTHADLVIADLHPEWDSN